VEGDCLERSSDSNSFGAVPLALVYGRVVAVVWPPSRWGWVERQEPEAGLRLRHRASDTWGTSQAPWASL
jgi:inner membrane protease subunit 2